MKFTRAHSSLSLLFCCARADRHNPKTVELALMSSVGNLDGFEYYINFTIGTPGQLQTVFIDTGSSNTFVFASNATFCETSGCDGGTFDVAKSSTYEKVNTSQPFWESFMLSRVWFKGDYVRDVVQLNDLVISKLPFGLVNKLKSNVKPYTGIMGLGYTSNMSFRRRKEGMPPTFLEGLVQAGAISSRLYSIYMNTLDQYGSILFGGVDTEKYKGPLTTLNLLRTRNTGKVDNFHLYLEEIKMEPYNEPSQTILRSTNDSKLQTLVDTGTPDWRIPASAYKEVVKRAGGEPAGSERANGVWPGVLSSHYVRPCSEVARGLANTTHFEITFAGNGSQTANLRLELADLFSPITMKGGSAATDDTGRPLCFLRVFPGEHSSLITSSSVMRAGYWVFDLDNGQISLAQANLGGNSSNVVQVEAGPEGLKKAAKNVRAEIQVDKVEGQELPSVSYTLSTATNTIGYATGIESYPTPTGAVTQTPSKNHSSPRGRVYSYVRRAESAAATVVGSEVHGFMVICVAIIVAVVTMAV